MPMVHLVATIDSQGLYNDTPVPFGISREKVWIVLEKISQLENELKGKRQGMSEEMERKRTLKTANRQEILEVKKDGVEKVLRLLDEERRAIDSRGMKALNRMM
jgi:hypothetical protein